jgi:hypothetical protein
MAPLHPVLQHALLVHRPELISMVRRLRAGSEYHTSHCRTANDTGSARQVTNQAIKHDKQKPYLESGHVNWPRQGRRSTASERARHRRNAEVLQKGKVV